MKIPKYQRIQNDLKNQLITGKFDNGDKFYTENELVHLYDVSSITVIRALNELVKDGYLVRKQGKGTFVSRSRKGKRVEFSDIERFSLKDDHVKILSVEKGNDPKYLKELKLTDNDCYYRIDRLRSAGNRPYIYQISYIPERFILTPSASKEHYQSIHQRFKLDFDIHMSSEPYTETHEVTFSTPEDITQILSLKEFEPTILQIRKTEQGNSDIILEYAENYKHWEFYKFEITANR
ncbi:GntR family transcriptional regulator [Streptococcus hillyeri]|uniref:GntR family transcriptional regulator n=1 Tax=Streptococcus hillyeri TaxID=2282420 RepID=A0A3L9DI17_9STRE|nr:GntR family transcriptional regulator [Streptococcus hillyeri]RLY01196.1 GntR family transcriptional regulator [Streptococcus hillyeri]